MQQYHELRRWVMATMAVALVGCGGGGGDSGANGSAQPLPASSSLAERCATPRPAGTINPLTGAPYGDQQGSVSDEKAWVRSWIDETYLWYQDVENLSAAVLDPAAYPTAVSYFNVLKSPLTTATGKPKDRFHFVMDTPSWVAQSRSDIVFGYGFQIALLKSTPPRSTIVVYTIPNSPAAAANIGRGASILSVDGIDQINDGTQAGIDILNAGLFPKVAGTHTFTLMDVGSTTVRSVTLTAGPISETPVQHVKTLPPPNQTVGYMEFDAHVATAESLLINAVAQLQAAQITDLVLDVRYNGGGLLNIASELAYMIAGPTATSGKPFEQLTFNDKNPFHLTASQTTTPFFRVSQGFAGTAPQALPYLSLQRVFMLVGNGTCSASEAIINSLRGVGVQVNLIGSTTCGKPYGFRPQDNCNTTYFAIQFQGVNAQGFGDYADGFTPTCQASDDFSRALGDPSENVLAAALAMRTSGTCVANSSSNNLALSLGQRQPEMVLVRPAWRENRIYTDR